MPLLCASDTYTAQCFQAFFGNKIRVRFASDTGRGLCIPVVQMCVRGIIFPNKIYKKNIRDFDRFLKTWVWFNDQSIKFYEERQKRL